MMTLMEVINVPQPITGDHIRKIRDSLSEIGIGHEDLTTPEMAVIAAATGLLSAIANKIDAKHERTIINDPMTSLDV